jgi:hypothetical protein
MDCCSLVDCHLNGRIFKVSSLIIISLSGLRLLLLRASTFFIIESRSSLLVEPKCLLHDRKQVLNSLILFIIHEIVTLVHIHDLSVHFLVDFLHIDIFIGIILVYSFVVDLLQAIEFLNLVHRIKVFEICCQHFCMKFKELQESFP